MYTTRFFESFASFHCLSRKLARRYSGLYRALGGQWTFGTELKVAVSDVDEQRTRRREVSAFKSRM